MDIWEANKVSTAYTPHPCTATGPYRCTQGVDCADICDQPGCDFNSYRMGDTTFYGEGLTVDTTKPITVVTQFISDTGTASGNLKEIRRLYVQNNVVIQNSKVNIPGLDPNYDSLTDQVCEEQKVAFSDNNVFKDKGGMTKMGSAMKNGMVLVLSIWDDYTAQMLWLDSSYPLDKDPSLPGITRGSCPTSSGVPADVESQQGNAQVIYSNIKFGDIGTTYKGSTGGSTTRITTTPGGGSTTTTSTTTSSGPTGGTGSPLWGQCGGREWTGPKTCAQGTCHSYGEWYSK
jgi:cellulose 1,4-beta-cellobiosidase